MTRHTADETAGVIDNSHGDVLAVRLRSARLAAGLTQLAAAQAIGVSRPLLIAIEKGVRQPKPDEIVRLASAYGVPVSRVLRQSRPPEGVTAQFRATLRDRTGNVLQGVPESLERAVSELEGLADDYIELARLHGTSLPRRYPDPVTYPTDSLNAAAEDLASSERSRLVLGDGPLTELRRVMEDEVGVRIFFPQIPSRVAGLFLFAEPLGACVAVNAVHPASRQRWTLAHEYGHFLTSRQTAEVTFVDSGWKGRASERFADAFAAAFLMPQDGLRRRVLQLRGQAPDGLTPADVLQLASRYQVSLQAVMLRCETLGLIPAGSYDDLVSHGFKPREAAAILGVPAQQHDVELLPMRYQLMAAELYTKGALSEGQLAQYLRTDRVAARKVVTEVSLSSDVNSSGVIQALSLRGDD